MKTEIWLLILDLVLTGLIVPIILFCLEHHGTLYQSSTGEVSLMEEGSRTEDCSSSTEKSLVSEETDRDQPSQSIVEVEKPSSVAEDAKEAQSGLAALQSSGTVVLRRSLRHGLHKV